MSTPSSPSTADRAAAAYRGDAGRAYHEDKRGVPARALPWVHRLRAAKFRRWVPAGAAVFELGVGAGWNLAALGCARRLGCDATDNPAVLAALAALGIERVETTAAVPDAWADVALCHHTLEHLPEPAGALRELARVLKADGRLVVHVPWDREWRYARFRPDDPNHHLHGWNAQSLGNLLTVTGWRLEEIRVRRYGRDRFAARLAAALPLGEAGFRALRGISVALAPLYEVEAVARPPREPGS